LTICKRLVEIMHGRIWLESELGKGSAVHFFLRLDLPARAEERILPITPRLLENIPALIIDDNLTNRRVLAGMLTRWGMRPVALDGGRAGLRALSEAQKAGHPFPVVLLDGQMPEMDGFALAESIRNDPALSGTPIMMLTSSSELGDAARRKQLDIPVFLLKPVRQKEVMDGICALLQSKAEPRPEQPPNRSKLQEFRRSGRVLLAEDNLVNQKLATRLLEKGGFIVTIVADGQLALDELERSTFDVVLMDVQMPNLDGFSATAAIREKEKSTGGHIPIIAMTAHALKGDEERCLAAGMDAYVSKPINTADLFAAIEKVLAKGGALAKASNSEEVHCES
jgi:two-component system, sensor histidine kinase and response regulator